MGTQHKTNQFRLLYCYEIQIANCSLRYFVKQQVLGSVRVYGTGR